MRKISIFISTILFIFGSYISLMIGTITGSIRVLILHLGLSLIVSVGVYAIGEIILCSVTKHKKGDKKCFTQKT